MIEITVNITGDTFAEAKEGAKALSTLDWQLLKGVASPSGKSITLHLTHGEPTTPVHRQAWWAEARRLRAEGKTLKATAEIVGKSVSAVCYATSPAALQTMRRYNRKE